MIRGIDAYNDDFLLNLDRMQQRAAKAREQISSGLRVTRPSDDPGALPAISRLQGEVGRTTQTQTNLSRVVTEVNTAESTLETAVQIVEQIRQAGVQGATDTATPESRKTLGDQIQQLHEQLVKITATSVSGRYIFSGDDDQTAQYSFDWTQPGGVVGPAAPPTNTRQVLDAHGTGMSVALTSTEIFDSRDSLGNPDANNIFHAVWQLGQALQANPPSTAAIQSAMTSITQAGDYLNQKLSFYGNVQDEIANATNEASRLNTNAKAELSSLQDTDIAAAALEIQQAQVGIQAAMGSQTLVPKKTLFDYLA